MDSTNEKINLEQNNATLKSATLNENNIINEEKTSAGSTTNSTEFANRHPELVSGSVNKKISAKLSDNSASTSANSAKETAKVAGASESSAEEKSISEQNKAEDKILTVKNLSISFKTTAGIVNAIRNVNFDVKRGETLAIVGESGSGKSVTTKAVMGILAKNSIVNSGSIIYDCLEPDNITHTKYDILSMKTRDIRKNVNGKNIAMVFQDPMTSLDPTMNIGKQIVEGMILHYKTPKAQAYKKALRLLEEVGITDAKARLKNYPHQLSGGMRQRIVIAIALANDPELLICDEPTTALDVTIQAKILDLIKKIQKKRNLSVIFITHNMGVVAKVADRINVMYAGRIVEEGLADEIFYDPRHPYTWGLLSAMPDLETKGERLYTIPGSPPNLLHKIQGDPFEARNAYALNIDSRLEPPMFKITQTHKAATWLLHPDAPKVELPQELKERINRMKEEAKKYEN